MYAPNIFMSKRNLKEGRHLERKNCSKSYLGNSNKMYGKIQNWSRKLQNNFYPHDEIHLIKPWPSVGLTEKSSVGPDTDCSLISSHILIGHLNYWQQVNKSMISLPHVLIAFLLIFYKTFVCYIWEADAWWREIERERKKGSFHPLVHSLNALHRWDWAEAGRQALNPCLPCRGRTQWLEPSPLPSRKNCFCLSNWKSSLSLKNQAANVINSVH